MRQSAARIQGVITGKTRAVGPIEAHERTVLAVTRRIHTLERERREIQQRGKRIAVELRHKRRELRALLQRDSSITEEQTEISGKADAVDASEARREIEAQHSTACTCRACRARYRV